MAYFKTSDHVKIYYELEGEGLPIIFIHGFAESGDVFRIQKRIMSKKYKLISYDIRSHGRSDMIEEGISMSRLSLDLKELISHLGIERVIVVAWSMGGSILLDYIDSYSTENIKKICLIDKSPKMLNDSNWKLGMDHGRYTEDDLERDLELIDKDFHGFIDKFIEKISGDLSEKEFQLARDKMKKNNPRALYNFWKIMGRSDYRNTLKKIDVETLIVFGARSKLYSLDTARYLRDNIEGSRLEIFPENGHLLVLENPRSLNTVLDDFISQ